MAAQAQIAPSILSADLAYMARDLETISGADLIHIDVMDGHFTGNLTFGVEMVRMCKRISNVPLDVHMMVTNPDETALWYADAGADYVTVHMEAATHLHRIIEKPSGSWREGGCRAEPRDAGLLAREHHRGRRHGARDERRPRLWRPVLYSRD